MLGDDVRLSSPANRNAAILNRFDGAGDLHQLARRLLWVRERMVGGVFHRITACDERRSPRFHLAYLRSVQSR